MQPANPKVVVGSRERVGRQFNQRGVVRLVQCNLALFPFLVLLVMSNSPYFNEPTVRQEVRAMDRGKRQRRLVDVLYAMLVQPIIHALLVRRTNHVSVFAFKSLASLPAARTQLNAVRFKQHLNHGSGYAAPMLANVFQRCAGVICLSHRLDSLRLVVLIEPRWGTFNSMPAQPVLDGRLIDTIPSSNLAVCESLVMNHAGQFVRRGTINAAHCQSCSGWSCCDSVAFQPLQDKATAHAKLLANGYRGHALRLVHLAEFMLWGRRIFGFGSGRRRWPNADAVGVQPFAHGLRLNRVHLCNLRCRQLLNDVQVVQDFRRWAWRRLSSALSSIPSVLFPVWRMVPSPRESTRTGAEPPTVGWLAEKRCSAHWASHFDRHWLSVLWREVNSKGIYLDYCGEFSL